MGRDGGHGAAEAVYQQKQLPTAKDPKMWCLKCNKAGKEKEVGIAILQKHFTMARQGQPINLKSAYCALSNPLDQRICLRSLSTRSMLTPPGSFLFGWCCRPRRVEGLPVRRGLQGLGCQGRAVRPAGHPVVQADDGPHPADGRGPQGLDTCHCLSLTVSLPHRCLSTLVVVHGAGHVARSKGPGDPGRVVGPVQARGVQGRHREGAGQAGDQRLAQGRPAAQARGRVRSVLPTHLLPLPTHPPTCSPPTCSPPTPRPARPAPRPFQSQRAETAPAGLLAGGDDADADIKRRPAKRHFSYDDLSDNDQNEVSSGKILVRPAPHTQLHRQPAAACSVPWAHGSNVLPACAVRVAEQAGGPCVQGRQLRRGGLPAQEVLPQVG